jgi:hypothetical protein
MRRTVRRRNVAVALAVVICAAVLDTVSPTEVVTRAGASTSVVIAVAHNHLVDAAGATVQPRGVDRSGTEFACTGDTGTDGWSILDTPGDVTDAESLAEMARWGINAVRIPLNEDCWLGINGVPAAYSGANYRTAISSYVALLHTYGMVAILDLHYNASGSQISDSTDGPYGIGQQVMADASHAPTFWSSVARTFLADPGVIFDLYNEPFDISWSCWLNGGCTAPSIGGVTGGWQVAGMQSLVDAVRATGADQPIMVGGLNYANDLTGWLAHEPTDPLTPPQIIASVHVYQGESCSTDACWTSTIAPVASVVPVVTGEFGPSSCSGSFVQDYLDWSDANGVSDLAWTWGSTDDGWDCAGSPALLEHDDGTPNAYGAAVEAHYQADAAAATPVTTTTTSPSTSVTTSTTTPTPTPTTVPSASATPGTTPVTTSPVPTGTATPGPTPSIALRSATLTVEDGGVAISVACRNARCSGTVELVETSAVAKTSRKHIVGTTTTEVLASRHLSLPKGRSTTTVLTIVPSRRNVVSFAAQHRVVLHLLVHLGGTTTTKAVRLS